MCARPLQIATLRKRKSRPISIGGSRWDGAVLHLSLHVQYTATSAWEHGHSLWYDDEPQWNVCRTDRVVRQMAMRALLNMKMAEGTPIRDHVLKMISHLNELDILGAEIDGESQVISCSCLYLSPIRTSASITPWVKEVIPWQNFLKNCRQQRGSLAMPRVHRLWGKGLLPLLQRRTRRRKGSQTRWCCLKVEIQE